MHLLSDTQDVVQESVDTVLQQGLRQLYNIVTNGPGPLQNFGKSLSVKLGVMLVCVTFSQPDCTTQSRHCVKCIITLIQLEMRLCLNCVTLEQLRVQSLCAAGLPCCKGILLLPHVGLCLLQRLRCHSGNRLGISCLHLWCRRDPLFHLPPFARSIRPVYSTHVIVNMVLATRLEFLSTVTQIPKPIAKTQQSKISALFAVGWPGAVILDVNSGINTIDLARPGTQYNVGLHDL
mmetsp:Transcript_29498/g.70740  ORF Transcript_29498/g.70740 Transcript_29498/m.70740 type:complete len:234 (-) Transcript_29498:88-789(-)